MRATWTGLALVGAIALGAAGCGSSNNNKSSNTDTGSAAATTTTTAAANKVKKIAIVTPEKRDDFGWNQQGVAGAEAVAKELGIQVEVADGSGYDNVDPILSQLANGGANLVIAHASGYNASAVDVATKTNVPELSWDNPKGLQPNLVGDAETDSQQGAYLAGVLAASTTKSKKLGIVVSADDTNWNKMAGGFIAGARSADPSVKFLYAQIGQAGYADSAGGKRVTGTVIAGGADVVFGMGDGSSFGMLKAVEDAGGKVKFIDVIGDKSSIDKKKVLLSSVVWNFQPAFKAAIDQINNGSFGTKGLTLDLANGGISLLQTPQVPADAWTKVESTKQKIIDGSVQVPLTPKKGQVQALLKK
jgi:simple sugar transport system substrate-binding protein